MLRLGTKNLILNLSLSLELSDKRMLRLKESKKKLFKEQKILAV
jgi:hypothetical protein